MTVDRPPLESGAPYAVRTTRRRGRMSEGKRTALADLLPRWSVGRPLTAEAMDHAFGRVAPRMLDVGVGTGEATLDWAATHPDHDVVAVELHRPGIARMLQELEAGRHTNVRILETDVTRLLTELTGPDAAPEPPRFEVVRVLFPDPWPKKRHLSRRLVDGSFVSAVTDLLPTGGVLHLATDWDDYAAQMLRALLAEPRLDIEADTAAFVDDPTDTGGPTEPADTPERSATEPAGHGLDAAAREVAVSEVAGSEVAHPWASDRPSRPVTTYERRGIQAGRRVTDLLARRRAG